MANVSFLDLMFAEALASGLAREAMREQMRPPPDNFFLLPPDITAWKKIQEASRKENMVVCIEFTDDSSDNCKPVQRLFMDLAREFEGIPFIRATIKPFSTYDTMRSDLGGVKYTPTILAVFYGDEGSVSRAKFEGSAEAREIGRIKVCVRELISRRVKLKTAERLAESLAERLQSQISDRERKMREEYETKLGRQMAEKEEEFQKKDEEKKKKEEKEEQERDQKTRLANERLRLERPQHLEALLKMNLDQARIKELKSIMEKMGVSHLGCLDRKDLKERLVESVPELRLNRLLPSETNNSSNSSSGSTREPLGGTAISNEVEVLKKELTQTQNKLATMTVKATRATDGLRSKDDKIVALRNQLDSLRTENSNLRKSSGSGPKLAASGDDSAKVKELKEKLLETRTLYTTTLQDFKIINVISECDHANASLVLRAKCIRPGVPNQDRVYAMKILSDCIHKTTQTQVSKAFRNEYEVLCQLPPHANIIHMWAFFYDRPGPDVMRYFKTPGGNVRGMGLFILMDEHPMSMEEQLTALASNRGPLPAKVVSWFKDLLNGLVFLDKHCVVHRDLKLSNLLLTVDGKMIICDFGKSLRMEKTFRMPNMHGFEHGGNEAHLAPEVLNCRCGPGNHLDYSKQPVWAAGVLAYELAGHSSPFASGTIDQRGYSTDQLPALRTTHCSNASHCQQLPPELTKLVKSMLQTDPSDRPTLQHCLGTVNNL